MRFPFEFSVDVTLASIKLLKLTSISQLCTRMCDNTKVMAK